MADQEGKDGETETRRVFGVVLRGRPEDFQAWLDFAKTYDLYVIYSKSTRVGKLLIKEEIW
ncbi:MAG: hypothetical protein QXT42_03365 [Thermoplasmata archaeon]